MGHVETPTAPLRLGTLAQSGARTARDPAERRYLCCPPPMVGRSGFDASPSPHRSSGACSTNSTSPSPPTLSGMPNVVETSLFGSCWGAPQDFARRLAADAALTRSARSLDISTYG